MEKLLLFLSKTDRSVYDKCPQSAKNNQLAFGVFVLLTGLLAFCSGTFALTNLFADFDWQTNQVTYSKLTWVLAPLLGLFYAFVIIAIDREVVSAKNKMAVVPRLFLAIVIGVVVAIPLELELLEGRIERQIIEDNREDNREFVNKKELAITQLNPKKDSLYNKIQFYENEMTDWVRVAQIELVGGPPKRVGGKVVTQRRGKGDAYRNAMKNYYRDSVNRQYAQDRYNDFIKNEYKVNKREADSILNLEKLSPEFDLLSKYQTLNEIIKADKKETNSAGAMSWGIRILFILFEIIPSLIKLMTPSSEYDALLEARRRMNIQLTNARANEALMDMENDIDLIVEDKNHVPLPYMNEIKDRIMT